MMRRGINRFLNRVGKRLGWQRMWALPRKLQLVPTNACNLRCVACPKTHFPTDNKHLHPDIYARVRDELFPFVEELDLQGLGEPLLSPIFEQMVEDAGRYGLRIKFVTNATQFSEEAIEQLVARGAAVFISIDGVRAETHEELRPGADFSVMREVLGYFRRVRERHAGAGSHLGFSTVVSLRNVEEMPELVSLGSEYGVDSITFISAGVGEREDEYAREVIARHPERFRELVPELRRRAGEAGIELIIPGILQPGEKRAQTVHSPSPTKSLFPQKCFEPWQRVYIDVDGWVRPCCRAIWIGMGNVMLQSFWEIWNGDDYLRLRKAINSNNPPAFCRTCTLHWGITGGDERYPERLREQGIELPDPPKIGEVPFPEHQKLSI